MQTKILKIVYIYMYRIIYIYTYLLYVCIYIYIWSLRDMTFELCRVVGFTG